MKHPTPPPGCSAEIVLPAPLDVAASLEGFRRWGDDLLDRWDGEALTRTVHVAGGLAAYAVFPGGDVEAPRAVVVVDDPAHLDAGVAAALTAFVTAPGPLAELRAVDRVVDRLEDRHRGVRPVRQPDLLTALVRSVSAQQVNLRWAATTRARLARWCGERHSVMGREVYGLRAERLAETDVADLRALQLTTRKAQTIVDAAGAVRDGTLDMGDLAVLPDEQVIERLTALKGIGRWSAEWLLARTLGRPRVVAGDLGVRKAVGAAYGSGPIASEDEVRALVAHWGAAAGVAQGLLLHGLVVGDDLTALRTA